MSDNDRIEKSDLKSPQSSVVNKLLSWLLPIFVAMIFIGVWQCYVWQFEPPRLILPSPWDVAHAWIENAGVLLFGLLCTAAATFCGLLSSIVFGTLISIVFSQFASVRRAFYPYVIFLQTVPIVAIVPLLIIWSGYNFRTVVLISLIVSLFPIVANVTAGLMSVDSNMNDLFTIYGASRLQTLLKLRIPAAVTYLIVGMRTSSGLAVIGAIIGEFFVGSASGNYQGLGKAMFQWQSGGKTPELMAGVVTSTILGLIFFGLINLLSRTLLRRWTASSHFESSS